MWLAILSGGRGVMLEHALKRDALSQVINGTKGASQHQVAAHAASRVYATAGVR